ncbi:MAG: hypothetical protein HYZ73_07625 [Elusimicrobia bacterium]|nr:hypothetical protein [Elusimicrobiota bacterium]
MRYVSRCFAGLLLGAVAAAGWAAPPQEISYQGVLREGDTPVTATKRMQFRVTNGEGTQVYWSSNDVSVPVSSGVFSAMLAPVGVEWGNVTPYLEVTVEGQRLEPREKLTASPYALVSHRVVDNGVTLNQLAPTVQDRLLSTGNVTVSYLAVPVQDRLIPTTGVTTGQLSQPVQERLIPPGGVAVNQLAPGVQERLLPSGLVAMFTNTCPPGWNRFTPLDTRFPKGAPSGATGGAAGGSPTHTHEGDGSHSHAGTTQEGGVNHAHSFSGRTGEGNVGRRDVDTGDAVFGVDHTHDFVGTTQGASAYLHTHGVSLGGGTHTHGTANHLPPFLEVVFCQKN